MLAVVAVLGGAIAAVFSPILDVDRTVVRGTSRVPKGAVLRAAGIERGDPILLVDRGDVAAGVEGLPWVATARVIRELPGTLRILVTERRAVGWARAGDRSVLVSAGGVVLGAVPGTPDGLPRLLGLEDLGRRGTRVRPRAAARVAAGLTDALRARATVVVVGEDGTASLRLADGPEVRLGDPHRITAKARAAEAVLLVAGPVAYVDVRVPDVPVTG